MSFNFFYWFIDDFSQCKIKIDSCMQNLCKFCVCLITLLDCWNNEDDICSKAFTDLNICNYIVNICKILKYLIKQDFEFFFQNFTLFDNIVWIDHEICLYNIIQFYCSSTFCFFSKTDVKILMHSDCVFNDCYYSYSVCEDMNRLIIHLVFLIHNILSFSSNEHIREKEF